MRVHITQQHNNLDSNWIQIWTAGVMPHNWQKSLNWVYVFQKSPLPYPEI